MLRFIVAFFFVLHGLVHLLYCGQAQRVFELQPGMVWPAGSWAFSRILGDDKVRLLATVALVLAAIGFVASGAGLFARQAWWRPVVVGAAMFSAAIFVLFWDGGLHKLSDQGAIAILINLGILFAVLILRWPNFGF